MAVEVSEEELYMQRAYSGKNRWPEGGGGGWQSQMTWALGHFILDGVWPGKPVPPGALAGLEGVDTRGGGVSSSPAVTEAPDPPSLPRCGSAWVLLTFSWSPRCWASTPHPSPSLWWSHIRLC